MDFLSSMKERAKNNLQTIVMPESFEERNLRACEQILKEGFANIILIGNKDKILENAKGLDINKAIFIDPDNYDRSDEFAETLCEIRKSKGITKEQAKAMLSDPLYFGVMLVKKGIAGGMVSGAIHATADVLRPALQILKTAPNTKLVSSFFIMVCKDSTYGNDGVLLFADTALNQNPNSEELAEIAISSAKSFEAFVGGEAKVAMLSHSTKGSAKHPDVDKVVLATKIAKEKAPELQLDGDLQLDAAVDINVAELKAPGSTVAGKANVLIFPDIDAGNIGYKLVHRFAGAEAYGPVLQGIAKPVNDLSRGCSADDIVGVVAMTAVQAQILS